MRRILVPAAFGLATLSCGPSFQTVYESDARFEHCYALDELPDVSMEKKGACWHDWMAHHTAGQTRDRVEYAAQRHAALERIALPTDEALMQAAPGVTDRRHGSTAPAPTSAYAPPPKTTESPSPAAPPPPPSALPPVAPPALPPPPVVPAPPAPAPSSARPPGSACLDACAEGWTGCAAGCGADTKGCSACDTKHARCLAACARGVGQSGGSRAAKVR